VLGLVKKNRAIVALGLKGGVRDTRLFGDGDFFDVVASCRHSSLPPKHRHPSALPLS